jgi:hypothetical protein
MCKNLKLYIFYYHYNKYVYWLNAQGSGFLLWSSAVQSHLRNSWYVFQRGTPSNHNSSKPWSRELVHILESSAVLSQLEKSLEQRNPVLQENKSWPAVCRFCSTLWSFRRRLRVKPGRSSWSKHSPFQVLFQFFKIKQSHPSFLPSHC